MLEFIHDGLLKAGVNVATASILARGIAISLVIVLSSVVFFVVRRQVLAAFIRLIARTPNQWDDTLVERKVLNRLSHLAPALLIYVMAPLALEGYSRLIALTTNVLLIYMLCISILVIDSFLNAVIDIYRTFEASRQTPIRGFVQIAKIGIYLIGGILVISLILNETPLYVFSGLGALTVVLMLIFKGAILGFVAGIQLT